jgi:hypothetical protein
LLGPVFGAGAQHGDDFLQDGAVLDFLSVGGSQVEDFRRVGEPLGGDHVVVRFTEVAAHDQAPETPHAL